MSPAVSFSRIGFDVTGLGFDYGQKVMVLKKRTS